MSLDARTSDLVRSIYGSIDDRTRWRGVIDQVRERTDSRMILVSAVDMRAGCFSETFWSGPDEARFLDGIRDYESDMFRADPTLAFGVRHPYAGQVGLNREIERLGGDARTDDYARWVRSTLGAADSQVRYTPPTNGLILGVSIHAPLAAGAQSRDALALFLMLFEHMERAMRLAIRVPDFASDHAPAIMVARDGRIVRASPAAQLLLDRKDGLARDAGRLVAASSGASRRLDAALQSALGAVTEGGAGAALALPRPSGRPHLLVRVDPLPRPPAPFEAFRPAAVVTVTEPDAAGVDQAAARRWAQLFGLTPAEIRLTTALLAEDASLRTVADRLGVAYATARVQLASVFDKVGVRSQVQLARLLTRLGGWMMALVTALDQVATGWA